MLYLEKEAYVLLYIQKEGVVMKKILNDVDSVEAEMIQGLVKSAPKMLRKLDYGTIVVRANKRNRVALVSGEAVMNRPMPVMSERGCSMVPLPARYLRRPPDQVLEGIKAVATEQGVLCIVKNYTGDIMNFEMAVEMAADEEHKADYVVVNDDVAVRDSLYTTGRRGVAGTVFVHKLAGAKAEQGASLADVRRCRKGRCQRSFHGHGYRAVYCPGSGEAGV